MFGGLLECLYYVLTISNVEKKNQKMTVNKGIIFHVKKQVDTIY